MFPAFLRASILALAGWVCASPAEAAPFDALHSALRKAEAGAGTARLTFWGDSHVAGDFYVGRLRQRLQGEFGDAGPGFVVPARAWRYFRHNDLRIGRRNAWRAKWVRTGKRTVRSYGPAGIVLRSDSRKARARIRAVPGRSGGGGLSRFEVYLLDQPDGGRLAARVGGARVVHTRTRARRPGVRTWTVEADGARSLQLRPVGDGEVRIFGVDALTGHPGVLVDTLGVNGAKVWDQLSWDADALREQVRRMGPDLIAFGYGSNEALSKRPLERYEADLREVVLRAQLAAPQASCLLIGPTDQAYRRRRSKVWTTRTRPAEITEIQRRVATDLGCGFFDTLAFMGGPGSMQEWVAAGEGAPDRVHLTRTGYQRWGDALHEHLMHGYRSAPLTLRSGD